LRFLYGLIGFGQSGRKIVLDQIEISATVYIMNSITPLVADLTILFGAIVVLAVTVVGFFKGRDWMGEGMYTDGKKDDYNEPTDEQWERWDNGEDEDQKRNRR